MSEPTWNEYLSEAAQHLSLARRALEVGTAVPEPPRHPDGAPPEDRLDECRYLALGYEQLSVEVETHLASIEQRLGAMARPAHRSRGMAHFFDTPL